MATSTRKSLADGDTFEHKGRMFLFKIEPDVDMGAPWEVHDGHGIVSEWTTRKPKDDYERVLNQDRDAYRYYDVTESIKRATRDKWGLGADEIAHLTTELSHAPTEREIIAAAVDKDYDWLKAWCDDEWTWVSVIVTLLKQDDDAPNGYFKTKHAASLGGIESNADEYLSEVGYELAEQIISEVSE